MNRKLNFDYRYFVIFYQQIDFFRNQQVLTGHPELLKVYEVSKRLKLYKTMAIKQDISWNRK